MIAPHPFLYLPVPGAEVPPSDEIGGKARNLARLQAALEAALPEARVPAWVALGAGAFQAVVGELTGGDPAEAQERIRSCVVPEALCAETADALSAAGLTGKLLAVRSSAVDEDGTGASFAGQFGSVLGVPTGDGLDAFWDAVRQVWASALNPHALAYRERGGAATAWVPMAVLVQEMVDPEVSGVAFSADPVTGDRGTVVLSAVYGVGEGLVSGELDADTYRVRCAGTAPGAVAAEVARKDRAVRLAAGGGTRVEDVVPECQETSALLDEEARLVARCARHLEAALGVPQDVEWALIPEPGGPRRLVVLQTRPITTLGGQAAPAGETSGHGERRVWDNSNIAESYGGVTTPLTFSFARDVYEQVYLQFCRLMGVSEELLQANRSVFANMLGLVRGRVYYNLLNWYRALALLPGFTFNRAYMERMMGVRQKLEDPPEPPYSGSRGADLLRLVRMTGRLVRESRGLAREVPAFHARVEQVLGPLSHEDLRGRSPDELVALYRRLEDELLHHWQTPIVNDFFAMIFFGVLCRLIEKWLPESPPTLSNDLLCGEGGIISTEPARRVLAMARTASGDPGLRALLASDSTDAEVWSRLREDPRFAPFHGELRAYLDRFGDRCMNELKLETVTLGEDPAFLIQTIRSYLAAGSHLAADTSERETRIRREAEALVLSHLTPLRRGVFRWVLAQARCRVRDRENLRFERTRVFGTVRRVFLALGEHLFRAGRLAQPRDVFLLTREELFGYVEGTSVTADLRALVDQRRREFAAYETDPGPPDRFETFGPVGEWVPTAASGSLLPAPSQAGTLKGTGCCPGVVRAPVRIVRDPREAGSLSGRILVAERTDPGWTLLFPAALGLLVQRGSLLSHSAIVAREIGLPCVVGLADLLATLRDGELVEMDGTTGLVRRLEAAGTEEQP